MEILAIFILFVVFAGSVLEKSDVYQASVKSSEWYSGKLSSAIYSAHLQNDSISAKDYRFSFKEDGDFDYTEFAAYDNKTANHNSPKSKL